MHRRRILAVTDGTASRRELMEGLGRDGYDVVVAHTPREAERSIKEGVFGLVLTDISAPSVDTLNFLSYFRDKNPVGKVIMLARKPDFSTAVQSLRLNATDYLYDPIHVDALLASVDKAFFDSDMVMARMRAHAAEENLRLKEELDQTVIETIMALAGALEARDEYTRGHSFRVAELAVKVGEGMRLSAEDVRKLRYGGILHDIGKIGVDKATLNKTTPLTSEEFSDICEHAEIGVRIVSSVESLKGILPMIKYHHEPYEHLATIMDARGREFLLVCIIKAADAFDAMVSDRPYRKAMPVDMALTELRHYAGTDFDPRVVGEVEKLVRGDAVRELRMSEAKLMFGTNNLVQGYI